MFKELMHEDDCERTEKHSIFLREYFDEYEKEYQMEEFLGICPQSFTLYCFHSICGGTLLSSFLRFLKYFLIFCQNFLLIQKLFYRVWVSLKNFVIRGTYANVFLLYSLVKVIILLLKFFKNQAADIILL